MNIYPVIKDALDEIYRTLPQSYVDPDIAVWASIEHLTQKYDDLAEDIEIDYRDPATKFAYLFKYAGSRACAVYSRHHYSPILANLYLRDSLVITSLGAGPGSDFLGVCKYLELLDNQPTLKVNFVDLDETWIATARILKNCACNHLNGLPLPVVSFWQRDLSGENIGSIMQELSATNLFTVSYLLSEMGNVANFLNELFSKAQPSTVFLILDNSTTEICTVLEAATHRPDLDKAVFRASEIKLLGENVEDLGCHFERFGDYERNGFPHITLQAACFIAVKK